MELNYIREFVILAEVRHFQKAADVLFMTQSTLSKHIRAIETELGHDLLIRSHKQTELSEFGKQFYPYARQLMEVQTEYTAALLTDPADETPLSIGCTPMVTLYNFIRFYNSYVKTSASARYSLIQGNTRSLLELLDRHDVDFILTENPALSDAAFRKIPYASDTLVAVLPKRHRLRSHEYVTIEDLAKETLVTFSDLKDPSHYLSRLYPETSFHASITVEKETLLFDLIRNGMGVCVITRRASQCYVSDDLIIKEIRPQAEVEIDMVCRSSGCQTPMGRAFAGYLKERASAEGNCSAR